MYTCFYLCSILTEKSFFFLSQRTNTGIKKPEQNKNKCVDSDVETRTGDDKIKLPTPIKAEEMCTFFSYSQITLDSREQQEK